MALAFVFAFLGGALGGMLAGLLGAAAGAAIGGWVGWRMATSARDATPAMPAYGVRRTATDPASAVLARLDAIEARLERLEARLGAEPGATDVARTAPRSEGASAGTAQAAIDATAQGQPAAAMRMAEPAAVVALPSIAIETASTGASSGPLAPAYARRAPGATGAAWAWFTGGNTLTRIGVVVLFFGVAFLLRWFAEHFALPLEWRLAAVAAAGAALLVTGLRLERTRAAYGLALEGAGAGILYLTTFAAFRLYDVLAPVPAFALLVVIAAGSVWLALRSNSQAMAALAFAGGFLAPVLVAREAGEPLPLFSYVALLNAAVFLIAWRRAWRGLNAIGFAFTFALALVWGYQYYAPRHFTVVEPFLVLFFAAYLGIAVFEAARSDVRLGRPVDALLVFGVPATAFALQHGLVRDVEHGMAWSAGALAAVYGVLAFALRARAEPGLALLARAFTALAIVFATLAIPFAVDARYTAAWWALEAAGAYWLGCRQPSVFVRAFALLLQLGAGAFVLAAGPHPAERAWFANAEFLGSAMIAAAALVSTFSADRRRDVLLPPERTLVPWVLAWGVLWWIGAGFVELTDRLQPDEMGHAFLAWVAGSALAACALARALAWPRIAWAGLALLPAMAFVAFDDLDRDRTTLLVHGTWLWPIAWAAQWATLAALDAGARSEESPRAAGLLPWLHALSVVLLVAHLSWEAGEWAGRWSPHGTSWITAATALPGIAFLALVARCRDADVWPLAPHRDAYVVTAATVIAALLAGWFLTANAISPGDPDPLPYVPLANPLDLAFAAALVAAWAWSSKGTTLDERTRYALLGLALFVALNGVVVRTVHHWLDVPWRLAALAASKPLQAALTLTWTATALPLMLASTRKGVRALWMVGAALLALVVVKLFALDLAALSGLPRVVAFLGVGALLLVIGYVAPLPPPADRPHGTPGPTPTA